jgi:polygalacturonase
MIKKTILLMVILLDSICAAKTIYVNDFGAVADGKTDSTPAFQKAFAQAGQEGPGVTIQLGKGRYVLSSNVPDLVTGKQDTSHLEGQDKEDYELYKQINKYKVPSCLKLENIHGLTVAGQGAATEIIVNCPMAGTFELWNCSDITMRDFCIDYDPIPFTQGTIIDINQKAGTFDYKIDTGFSQLSEYWFLKSDSRWGIPFDDQRRFRQGGLSAIFCKDWGKIGESTWRMNLDSPNQAAGLKVGDRYIHIARTHNPAIGFYRCAEVSIENLQFYASPSSSTIFYQCEGTIHVNGLQAKPRPGSGRIFGPNADGVHCQSLRKGPIIENCVFEGMADDAMNFYAAPSVINEIISPDKVRVKEVNVLRKGDHIQIIEPSTGTIKAADMEVTSVEGNVITFAKGVEGLKAGKNHVEADTIFNLSACGSGFIVRNNIIGGFRGRGVVARAHHGLIENNLIHDTSGNGILLCNEPDWPEGPIPADITIQNNTIISVNRDQDQRRCGAIQVSAFKLRYEFIDKPQLHNVVIKNNKIIDSPGSAILLQGVCDANVTNNLVQLTANDRPIEEYYGIKLDSCKDIKIDNFTITDQWGRVNSAVFLDGTPKENVSIKNINADLNNKGQLVKQK